MATFYEVLGVTETASQDDVRDAYRRQAMKWHPDRNPNNRIEAEERFKTIANAYTVLSDSQQRIEYDHWLASQRTTAVGQQYSGISSGPSVSSDEAAKIFFEQMLDLAMELAARGYDSSQIARALIGLNCPSVVAEAAAAHAVKRHADASGFAHDQRKPSSEEIPPLRSIEGAAWQHIRPYFVAFIGAKYADEQNSPDDDASFLRNRRLANMWLVLASTLVGGGVGVLSSPPANAWPLSVAVIGGAIFGLLFGMLFAVVWSIFIPGRGAWIRSQLMRYYLDNFRALHTARPVEGKRFNWGAAFFSYAWAAYRRMPWWSLALSFLWIVLGWISIVLGYASDNFMTGYSVGGLVAYVIHFVVMGNVGTRIYFRTATNEITKTLDMPFEQATKRLRERGGTNSWSWLAYALLSMLLSIPAQITLVDEMNKQTRKASLPVAISEMEARHPEIDPKSPSYRQSVVDEINRRMQAYQNKGAPPADALRQAVLAMEQEATARQKSQP